MIQDRPVRRLMKLLSRGMSLAVCCESGSRGSAKNCGSRNDQAHQHRPPLPSAVPGSAGLCGLSVIASVFDSIATLQTPVEIFK